MKFIISYFLLNFIFFVQASENLTDIIRQHQKQDSENITIYLDESKDYYLDGRISVGNLTIFNLNGTGQSVTCNQDSQPIVGLEIQNVSHVSIEGIRFNNCNENAKIKDKPTDNSGFLTFISCYTVSVTNCKFNNVSGINILCVDIEKVVVEKSKFRSKDNGSSKAILVFSNISDHSSELWVKRAVFEGNTWVVNYFNDQVPSESFGVNCGSAVSVCHLNKGNSTIRIEDSTFIGNKAAQGASVCIDIGINHTSSDINIVRGTFTGGRLNNSWSKDEMKETPAGGAIAMFIQGEKYKIAIQDSIFENNYGPNGGAVFIDYTLSQGSSIILNCIFKKNNGSSGGALMLASSGTPEETFLELKNSTFIGNRGSIGGAILSHRVSINVIDEVTISENSTPDGNGGGIALVYSEVFVYGILKILNNSAGMGGGGVYMSSESRISMNRTKLSTLELIGNSAKTYGGGMYVYSLYYENKFIDWDSSSKENSRHCFLIGEEQSTIRMLDNTAGTGNGTCAGNKVYTQLLGRCFDKKYIKGNFDFTNATCDFDTREESFLIELKHHERFKCNDGLFDQIDKNDNYQINMSLFCNASFKPTIDNMNTRHITHKMITELHKNHEAIKKFYFMYPGYTFQVTISSKDYFSHFVVTRANLSGIVYADGAKRGEQSYQRLLYDQKNPHIPFLTNHTSNITIKSRWKGLGVICVESIGDFYKKDTCIGIIVGHCPPGLRLDYDECLCDDDNKGNGYTCTDEKIQIVPGKYLSGVETKLVSAPCLWFRCKCYFGAKPGDCVYNPLNPNEQCNGGLTGTLCGKCINNKTPFMSPFLNSLKGYSSCIDCDNPALMIILFFLIVIVFMFIIMLFRINLFGDYWRSIIFYANILYLILVNSSPYISSTVNYLLAVPILPLNFLITQMIPFCLQRENRLFVIVLFDMTVPLVTAALFILVQRFLITRISWLSTRNIPTQIWSIVLLTYTDLSIHAFMILTCPAIKDKNFWLYEGDIVCFQSYHLVATSISLLYLFVLFAIPLFLLFITLYSKQDFQFHHNITKGFKHKFRWWEIYKLFLRLAISITLSFMPNFVDSDVLKFVVAILCLLTMIMNSLFQPANNQLSNHFESVCFLFLALTAVPQQHWNFNCFPTLPFIVGTIAMLLFRKIPFWIKQISRIKATFQEKNNKMETIKKIFKIWDVKSTYELDAM